MEGFVSELDEIRKREPLVWIPLEVVFDRKSMNSMEGEP